MLKHGETIQKLNLDSKLSLVADGNTLFTHGNPKAGIMPVSSSSWDDINKSEGYIYPPLSTLANSWNTELISQVSSDIAARAKSRGAKMLFTPEIRVKSNPYINGISEDPYFVRAMVFNVVNSIKEASAVPCLTGMAIGENDIKFLDNKMDMRTMREYFYSPYKVLSAIGAGVAAKVSYAKLGGTYELANAEVLGNMLKTVAENKGLFLIGSGADSESVVKSAASHTLMLDGKVSALKQALVNYDYIRQSMNTGDASGADLENACRENTAISYETVDEAVDYVIDFAGFCNGLAPNPAPPADDLPPVAAEESIVLLKNEDILPLRKKAKIAIIGDPAFKEEYGESFVNFFTSNGGYEVVGAARGYDLSDDRNERLLEEACTLAKKADVVLLFLGLDKKREQNITESRCVTLPANRIALVDGLTKVSQKVVGVLTNNCQFDVSFDGKLAGLMVAPLDSASVNEALTRILMGISCPSGKLANSYYEDTDNFFNKIYNYKNSGRLKVGGFIGYRYYDTAGEAAKYPFGFGLSYTAFTYSGLSVTPDCVEVTVKNSGRYDGAEVVQMYVGKPDSHVLRPLKELKNFIKVFLKAGESRTVKFKLNPKLLAVYDGVKCKNVTEDGDYIIYVGSSVSDIKLIGKVNLEGSEINRDNKNISDYLLTSSNVLTDGYTLKDVKAYPKKGKKCITAGLAGAILALIAAGALFALQYLGVLDGIHFLDGVNFLWINDNQFAWLSLGVIALAFVAFFITFIVGVAKRQRAKKRAVTVYQRESLVANQPEHPFETLFDEQFTEEVKPAPRRREEVKEEENDDGQDALRYFDASLTFRTACAQFASYCTARGIQIDTVSAGKVLAAMGCSRSVFVKCRVPELFPRFVDILSGYFGSETNIDEFNSQQSFEDLLTREGEPTRLSKAISEAADMKQNVHIAALSGVKVASVRKVFTPFLKYVLSPENACTIKYGYDKKLTVTPNVWFLFGVADGSHLSAEDTFILNSSAVIDIDISPCQPSAAASEVRFVSYYQLVRLAAEIADKYPMDEDKCWKKIDKFEKFVKGNATYRIGNKIWLRAEKFASATIACGAEQSEALDGTVASILLPAVITTLGGRLNSGEESVSLLEGVLGEDSVTECKKILASFTA